MIGYSVPATDLTTQALIKSSLSRAKLRLLVVVNPDEEARRRVIKLARSAIGSNTRVLEMGTLRDFGETLEETPEQRRRRSAETLRLRSAISDVRRKVSVLESNLDDWGVDEHGDALEELERRVDGLEDAVES